MDKLGEAHRKGYAFAHLCGGRDRSARALPLLLELAEQQIEALLQKLPSERGVSSCALEICVADR
ncbi:MAG TPA: hypothetical protein VEJ37_08790 [Xanthobacteraceae bacterium]|nr:hypothetical protein [Xanthobacteraceae bacterium]